MEVIQYDKINQLFKDGDTVAFASIITAGVPSEILYHLVENHKKTGQPNQLTILSANNLSDNRAAIGIDNLVEAGMVKRYITNIFISEPLTREAILHNEIEVYNFPQGVTAQYYRTNNALNPGTITKIGLHTHVDPRQNGGRVNDITKEELVDLVEVAGEEYLHYHYPAVDVCVLRGTYADELGNIYLTEEAFLGEGFGVALAAHHNGGKVIVQVKKIIDSQTQNPKDVFIPGHLVDYVTLNENPELHAQLTRTLYDPLFSGERKCKEIESDYMPLNSKKVILRRALQFLKKNDLAIIGYGISNFSSQLLLEEQATDLVDVMIDLGTIGGYQGAGQTVGMHYNLGAMIRHEMSWDMIYAGGVDIALLSFAEIDQAGNVNVSRFGGKINGMGGFIDISQSVKRLVFSGTMTIKADSTVSDAGLTINKEGKASKFVEKVEQIDFNGQYAVENEVEAYYVTERAVFKLVTGGIMLIEIARGLDLQKDVLDQMDFTPLLADEIGIMSAGIYRERWGGLRDELQVD